MTISLAEAAEGYKRYRREGMDHGVVGAYELLAMKHGAATPALDELLAYIEGPKEVPALTAYCSFCRAYFTTAETPPYAALHVNAQSGEPVKHLHAISREELTPAE